MRQINRRKKTKLNYIDAVGKDFKDRENEIHHPEPREVERGLRLEKKWKQFHISRI